MPKKLVREPFFVSLISGIERIFASEGDVTIFDFLSNFFLSHSAEEFRRETFQCVTLFGCRKSLDKREEGVSRFSRENFLSKIFCLTVPKSFVGEPFCAVFQIFRW